MRLTRAPLDSFLGQLHLHFFFFFSSILIFNQYDSPVKRLSLPRHLQEGGAQCLGWGLPPGTHFQPTRSTSKGFLPRKPAFHGNETHGAGVSPTLTPPGREGQGLHGAEVNGANKPRHRLATAPGI